jgi:molybdenum cofactor cytidylyltransferase
MIVAVVPAAGLSRRMGACKQLLPFAGTTVIGHIVDELKRSRIDEIRVVVGHQADWLREELLPRGVRIIVNPDYQQTEMLDSIRCGLAELPPECRAVLVALADQPAIRAELIDAMIECFAATGRGIVVPVYSGHRKHPLLFAASYCNEILSSYDQVGLRGLMAAHMDDVFEMSIADHLAIADMDYPEDYRRELAKCSVLPPNAATTVPT